MYNFIKDRQLLTAKFPQPDMLVESIEKGEIDSYMARNHEIDIDTAIHFGTLKKVTLFECEISDAACDSLFALPGLQELCCRDTIIHKIGPHFSTSLKTLGFPCCRLTNEQVKLLSERSSVTDLDLTDNRMGPEGAKSLSLSTTIKTLNIKYNTVGNEGALALASNTTLTTLDIGDNYVSAVGTMAFAKSTTIETLGIYNTEIGCQGAKALAANTSITSLTFDPIKAGYKGIRKLAKNTTLTHLTLYFITASNPSISMLADITSLQSIKLLGYSEPPVPIHFAANQSILSIDARSIPDSVKDRIQKNRHAATEHANNISVMFALWASLRFVFCHAKIKHPR